MLEVAYKGQVEIYEAQTHTDTRQHSH